MAQDTLLGFPAHTLPFRRGEFTTLLTVWGVAECYAFSCFHDNVGLRYLPAIRHIKGTDAVVVDHDTLIGNAVLLFSVVHLNMVDQLRDHALCNGGRVCVFSLVSGSIRWRSGNAAIMTRKCRR